MESDLKVFFININPGGFGYVWAEEALKMGHRVIITARDTDLVDRLIENYGDLLLYIPLDLADRNAGFEAIEQGREHFGRIDVAVDAGFDLLSGYGKSSPAERKTLVAADLFGLSWPVEGVIPVMKKQGYGHIVQVASTVSAKMIPTFGHYPPPEWGMGALCEIIAWGLSSYNIKLTLIEAVESGGAGHSPSAVPGIVDAGAAALRDAADLLIHLTGKTDPPLRYRFGTG